jgi:chromosome segregation ATPase
MNDLSNTITPYLTVRDLIRDNLEDPKVLNMAVELLEYFINNQDEVFEKAWDTVVKGSVEDIEPLDPAYAENDKEQIYKNYRAAIDEYNKLKVEYDSLQTDYEQLQDLFYRVDSELDELKVKYDQVQNNYHTVVSELKQSLK